jgi:protein-disulfide isomerase
MATTESASFRAERCAAMLARYEDYAASALRFVEGRRELGARDQRTPHGPAPSLGPDDATVTLVLFCDFDAPDCGRVSPLATTIRNLHPDVRLVFRQFPLRSHAGAHRAAQASLAAHAQGKFWAFHDVLFGNPQAHERPALERYAKAAGLNVAAFKLALDRGTFAADVDADLELGRKLGISAVPALYVNGRSVRVPYGAAELAELLADGAPKRP